MTHIERARKELERTEKNLDAAHGKAPAEQIKNLIEKVLFWCTVVDALEKYGEE